MNMHDGLRIIAARAPSVAVEAAKSLRSSGFALQHRYNVCVEHALSDPEARFTEQEREALLSLVDWPTADDGDSRDYTLRVRLSDGERRRLEADAEAQGAQSVSEYVRGRLFA